MNRSVKLAANQAKHNKTFLNNKNRKQKKTKRPKSIPEISKLDMAHLNEMLV